MKLRNTLALIGGISLGSYLIYRHWEKLIEFLEIIGYTLGELFNIFQRSPFPLGEG